MFGRFFAFEMGCPDEDTYLTEGEIPEEATMVCECRGLGCNKCKRKKAKIITLTGPQIPLPIMNIPMSPLPTGPMAPGMIMMGNRGFF